MSERPDSAAERPAEVALARSFGVLAGLTFCLIVVGSLVRAHDAGLACPDWPLCLGEFVPPFDLKVAFEWGHRVFAASVSLGLLALSWLGLRRASLRERLIPRLLVVWTLLLVQVVFGGLTVLLQLAPWTVSAHLVLGNSFCLALLWISRDLYESFGDDRTPATLTPRVALLVAIVGAALALQIVLGGMVSSHYAGLACTTFPTCNGESIAPSFQGLIGMHVIHRLNGFVLLAAAAALAWATRRQGRVGMLAWLALRLLLLQIFIGVMNVQLRLPPAITAFHTGLAAAIVLTAGLMVREVVGARRALPDSFSHPRAAEAG